MNYTYKNIWLINFPVMMSILIEQLINITDAIFLGHVGEIELGASALFNCDSDLSSDYGKDLTLCCVIFLFLMFDVGKFIMS